MKRIFHFLAALLAFVAIGRAEQFSAGFSNGATYTVNFTYTVNYSNFQVHGVEPDQHKRYLVTGTITVSGGTFFISGPYGSFSRGGPGTEVQTSYMPIGSHAYSVRKFDNDTLTTIGSTTITVTDPDGPQPQTVTISPTSSNLLMGAAAVFTASGGQNGYQWSISSGGGLAASGANAAYTGTAIGTYTIKVWSPAGNGYAKSNEATATVIVAGSFTKQVAMQANNGSNPIKYRVFQDGEVVAEYTQNPGDSARIVSVIVSSNSPITVASQVVGVHQESDGAWIVQPGGNSPATVSNPVVPQPTTPGQPDTTPPIPAPVPNAPNNAPSTNGKQTGKIVWGPGSGNMNPANQTDLLTNATFKQGVDRLADNTDEILKEMKDRREKEEKSTQEIKDSTTKEVADYLVGMQAALVEGASFGEVVTNGRTTSSVTIAPQPPGDLWTVTDENLGTFSLNPFESPKVKQGFRSLVTWVRALVGWAIVLGLTAYVYSEMRKAMVALMTIPQHKFVVEQVVQGSQWTTLTTWVARAGVRAGFVAFIIAIPTACIQLFSTEWSELAVNLAASVSDGAAVGGGMSDGAGVADFIALVNCVLPIATIFSAGATYAAVEFGLINLQSIWMVFFRLSK